MPDLPPPPPPLPPQVPENTIQNSPKKEESILGRRALLFSGALGATGVAAELSGGYVSKGIRIVRDSIRAYELRPIFERLDALRSYFELKEKELSAIKAKDIETNPWGVYAKIKEARTRLQEGIGYARKIADVNIHFNPTMFASTINQLQTSINRLNSAEVDKLHKNAECFEARKIICNVIGRVVGIDRKGIIAVSKEFRNFRYVLSEFKKALEALIDPKIMGFSDNFAIDQYLKFKNPFDRDMDFGDQGRDVRKLQEFLEINDYLEPGYEQGVYDLMTKESVYHYQKAKKIVRSKNSQGAGRLGPRTRQSINEELTR